MSEAITSYADLAITLAPPHGPDTCGCLVCSDAREASGHRPLTPEFYPLTPDCSGAGTSDDTADNTAEAKNLVPSSAPERPGILYRISEAGWQGAATRIGITLPEYRQRRRQGERWCSGHADWHDEGEFSSASANLAYCQAYMRSYQRARYLRQKEAAS